MLCVRRNNYAIFSVFLAFLAAGRLLFSREPVLPSVVKQRIEIMTVFRFRESWHKKVAR